MFRRKHKSLIEVTKLSSFVATNVEVRGDIHFSGGLRVDGRVDGNVISNDDAHGLLVLSEKGHVKGNVRVHDAVINGTIDGDLAVGHFLELQPGARVTGSITYCQLKMDCGATVTGKLECIDETGGKSAGPAPAPASANVVGIAPGTRVAAWPQP
jgi:cytoskeletal protein CcmA (bactofilin family)